MKIFTRHVFAEFVRPFIFLAAVFGGISVISDFFRDLGLLLDRRPPAASVIAYLALTNIHKIFQLMPVAVLVATLFSVGQMARSGELTAVKTAGRDIRRAFIPFFAAGAVFSAVVLIMVFAAVPPLVSRGYEIRRSRLLGLAPEEEGIRRALSVSVPPSGRLQASVIDVSRGYMDGVVYYEYDGNFSLSRQIVARRVKWKGDEWEFIAGAVRVFKGEMISSEKEFVSRKERMSVSPSEFILDGGYPEELGFKKHLARIGSLKKLGLPHRKEAVNFHYRIASSASAFVVLFIGVYFAATVTARHGKIYGFVAALLMAFLYYGVSAVGQSLGENGILPPLAAAWTGNIIFGAAGLRLFLKIPS